MGKYFLTHSSTDDINSIWNYTCTVWSESQADKYFDLLLNAFEAIAENPSVGKSYKEIGQGVFGTYVGKHIIMFRINSLEAIEIIRVLHGRMDLISRMKDEP